MLASVLIDACLAEGIGFFAGVPDSFLKGLCNELYARYGTDSPHHIVAHNEGGAVALCAGHYLATGHPALCYMQNSGLGNAVNPLASLTDSAVYRIPCLLIIGWRGQPGVPDEPQHVRQGKITLSQLDLLNIPYHVLSRDTSSEAFSEAFADMSRALSAGHTAALVICKGALETDRKPVWPASDVRMTREEAAGILLSAALPEDIFVSTTGKLSREVFEYRARLGQGHQRDFLTVGSMGHAAMIALGMAESLPGRKVWCMDGDGAMLMHLGSLPLIGRRAPANLIHVIFNNGAHETVGGMPVCSGALRISELARAAGYPAVFSVSSPEELHHRLMDLKSAPGPVLLEVRCACRSRADLGRPTDTPQQNKRALQAFLGIITKS